ncbi:hypothetical protein QTP70_032475 [Hemibagrus guttatus]|uniref:Endonuclease/exonuclease/phosphatase domain-containing protein n=1 Tax=Hemibagrus guttatus TaxID=175788 RepID=A0AAE0R0W5_9TELE|nr:hypothetical protein QTP70_032475 [Hemibagrus guttatus]
MGEGQKTLTHSEGEGQKTGTGSSVDLSLEEEQEEEQGEEPSPHYSLEQTRQLEKTVSQIKENLSLQEVELTELKEMVLSNLHPNQSHHYLKDQLSLIKTELNTTVLELKVELKKVQEDKDTLRTELNNMRRAPSQGSDNKHPERAAKGTQSQSGATQTSRGQATSHAAPKLTSRTIKPSTTATKHHNTPRPLTEPPKPLTESHNSDGKTVYIPPSDSPYYDEEIFPQLHTETCSFQAQGNVLICGDLNARTGALPDLNTEDGNYFIFGQHYPRNLTDLPHHNFDSQVNKNGQDLLQLCESLGLYTRRLFRQFSLLTNTDTLPFLLGERKESCILAGQYVSASHKLRDSCSVKSVRMRMQCADTPFCYACYSVTSQAAGAFRIGIRGEMNRVCSAEIEFWITAALEELKDEIDEEIQWNCDQLRKEWLEREQHQNRVMCILMQMTPFRRDWSIKNILKIDTSWKYGDDQLDKWMTADGRRGQDDEAQFWAVRRTEKSRKKSMKNMDQDLKLKEKQREIERLQIVERALREEIKNFEEEQEGKRKQEERERSLMKMCKSAAQRRRREKEQEEESSDREMKEQEEIRKEEEQKRAFEEKRKEKDRRKKLEEKRERGRRERESSRKRGRRRRE